MAIVIDLTKSKAVKIKGIKDIEAKEIIYSAFPDYKQSNMLARAAELLEKKIDGFTLTTDEQRERKLLIDSRAWIESVRQAARDAISQARAATTVDGVNAVEPSWPTTPPQWPIY
jgi:uncharacterized protein YnzC (UPF0291/DUF896 family)